MLILLFIINSWAHPVIYKDGVVVSSSNMQSFSDNQLMYSWHQKAASGLNHWRFSKDGQNTELALAKTNYLLFRHNGDASQANIYLHAGVGILDGEIERKDTREVYMAGVDVDWETRILYTSAKYYHFTTPAFTDIGMLQGRVGFSPFEAPFEQLQTWFMLQGMYLPVTDRKVMVTPLLRFFYKNVLWEMGASTRGEWLLNLMVHH